MLLVLTRVLGSFPAHFTLLFSSLNHKALFLHQTGCPWDLRVEHGGFYPSWPPHLSCIPLGFLKAHRVKEDTSITKAESFSSPAVFMGGKVKNAWSC